MSVDSLQAMHAAQAEASDTPHIVTIRGETFAFRRLKSWPAKALRMMNQGELDTAMAMGLVDRDADEARWLDVLEPTLEECEQAFSTVSKAAGVESGESSASTASSNGSGAK